ncbi:single-stranded-DNA-specific exonuclease RecJ [Spirochaeta africana]|uniref:Single-stranded-DNA-specific exonuclease RecJ n=1 Tax=Spirochaeta africana (strain ATCC 700263 / DSM 8902 / Z-7692) TaxID=889378 RepID=H9UJ13_SPIAZ|nr:single-stranded-DNA-specific exonuclease RecJ [Spirochaeta africana]AFG37506.1 single-stranded-DNA-specific exonuclease RecJ [Spirochaeta africana DSM 8902]
MIWEKPPIDRQLVRRLAESYEISPLVAAILVRRGLTEPEDVQFILEEDLRSLHNPFLFEDMETAVDRIMAAIEEGERILVYGDRDADGMTSIALMVSTLEELGADVRWRLPMGDDPYGLTIAAVEEFARDSGTLIITVDCGSTNVQEIRRAEDLGIDTIVIDHHNLQEEIPPALALINPKVPDCGYPFDGLCGCGVTAKVVWALQFARTNWYKEPICLLQVTPGNDSVIVDAVKLRNLVEVERIREFLVAGVVSIQDTRLFGFLQDQQILAYDVPPQQKLLQQVFGQGVEFQMVDTAEEIAGVFPPLRGKSLLRMQQKSRKRRFTGSEDEIDTFCTLFRAFVFRKDEILERRLQSSLDLAAMGTIADMMPLRNENRTIVKAGLRTLANTPRPGLRRLLELQGVSGVELSAQTVAWQVTPVLNAGGRMGRPDLVVKLLLSTEQHEVLSLADEVRGMNEQRKKIGSDAWKRILPAARKSIERFGDRLAIVFDPGIHRGVTGILAGRLARTLGIPSAVVTEVENHAVGSIRSSNGVPVTPILRAVESVFTDWGGHDFAAGFNLPKADVDQLLAGLAAAADGFPFAEQKEEVLQIDAELPHQYLEPGLEAIVSIFGPFGQEHDQLMFLGKNLHIEQLDIVGKSEQSHVKLLLGTSQYKWPAMFWNAAERVNQDFSKGDRVDVVFHLGKNTYQNKTIPQLLIVDIRRVSA